MPTMGSVRSFQNLKDDLLKKQKLFKEDNPKKQNNFKEVLSCVLLDNTDMFIVSKDNEIVPFHKSLLTLFSPLVARLMADVPCCVAPTIFLPDFPAHIIRKFLLLLKSGQAVSGKNIKIDILFIHKIASTLMIKVDNLGEGQYLHNPLGSKIKQENVELNIKQELSDQEDRNEDHGVEDSEYVEDESEKMLQEDALDDSASDSYLSELLSELNADSESLTDSLIDNGRLEKTSKENAENEDKDDEQEEIDDNSFETENSNDIFSIASFFDESTSSDNSMNSDKDDNDESTTQHDLLEDELTKNIENASSIIKDRSEYFDRPDLPTNNPSSPGSPLTKSNTPPHTNYQMKSVRLACSPLKETLVHTTPSNKSSQINSKSKKDANLMTLIPVTPPKERKEHVPAAKYTMTKEPSEKIVNPDENKSTEISTSVKSKYPRERDAFMRTVDNGGMRFTNDEYSEVYNFIIEVDAPKIKVEPEEYIMQREENKMKRIDFMSTLQKMLTSEEDVESKEKVFSLSHDMEIENLDTAIANAKQAEKDDIDCLLDDIDNLEKLEKEFVQENENVANKGSRKNIDNNTEINLNHKTSGGKRKANGRVSNINKKAKIYSNIPKDIGDTIVVLDDSE